jgi:hypothetical protein
VAERRLDLLLALLVAHAAATLAHFGHNAEHVRDYPNLPAWLSRADVYGSWLALTAIGLAGYSLVRWRHPVAGHVGLAVYGLLGLGGLAHYALAPPSAHTLPMNASIWLEAATGLSLLTCVVRRMKVVRQP